MASNANSKEIPAPVPSLQKLNYTQLGIYLPPSIVRYIQPLLPYAFIEPNYNHNYTDYYSKYRGFKLLDNGYIERGESLDLTHLVSYANSVGAHRVVAPDKLGDWDYNYTQASCLSDEIGPDRVMVCLAGPDYMSFKAQITQCPMEWAVALPYRLNRVPLGHHAERHVHLLGMRYPEVVKDFGATTMDTTQPITAACHVWDYEKEGLAVLPRLKNYDTLTFTNEMTRLAIRNVTFLMRKVETGVYK